MLVIRLLLDHVDGLRRERDAALDQRDHAMRLLADALALAEAQAEALGADVHPGDTVKRKGADAMYRVLHAFRDYIGVVRVQLDDGAWVKASEVVRVAP